MINFCTYRFRGKHLFELTFVELLVLQREIGFIHTNFAVLKIPVVELFTEQSIFAFLFKLIETGIKNIL